MEDWTEERERSVTSRQAKLRARSARVRVLQEEEEDEASARSESVSFWRTWRMTGSGLTRFLKGWRVSSSDPGSGRRRFFLSAIEVRESEK